MGVNGVSSSQTAQATSQAAYQSKIEQSKPARENAATEQAAVYEKSSANNTMKGLYTKYNTTDRSAIVSQLKADADARAASMQSLVEKLFSQQSKTFQTAYSQDPNSIWNQIRQGNFTADAQTIAQAKEDISEDGYWGVKQTSERLLDFAKAISGGDSSKIDTLTKAIEKGFKQATKLWGGELPDISKQTYDAVMKGMEDWKNEVNSPTVTA